MIFSVYFKIDFFLLVHWKQMMRMFVAYQDQNHNDAFVSALNLLTKPFSVKIEKEQSSFSFSN